MAFPLAGAEATMAFPLAGGNPTMAFRLAGAEATMAFRLAGAFIKPNLKARKTKLCRCLVLPNFYGVAP